MAARAGMDFSFSVSRCISGFLFCRLAQHPAALEQTVCAVPPTAPVPCWLVWIKKTCPHIDPRLAALFPSPGPPASGIPFCQYNLPLQGFKAKGSYVFPKAALIKELDDCKDERDWVPASPPILSQGCCCQYLLQLFPALVGGSVTAGASMLLESSLHNASYSS